MLFIVKENDTIVAMRTSDWFESDYVKPDYVAPDEQSNEIIPYEEAKEYISGIIY